MVIGLVKLVAARAPIQVVSFVWMVALVAQLEMVAQSGLLVVKAAGHLGLAEKSFLREAIPLMETAARSRFPEVLALAQPGVVAMSPSLVVLIPEPERLVR